MKASDFFSKEQQAAIIGAIEKAEQNTSGEIRIHIENRCPINILDRTVQVFEKLKMHKTQLRNGVLIYLAIEDKKFAIIGDAGIHAKVGDDFWNHVKEEMLEHFRHGRIVEGIEHAVMQAGIKLKVFFPKQQQDVNELPDDIVFGNPDK